MIFIENLGEDEKLLALYNWALNFLPKQYCDIYGYPCRVCLNYNTNFKDGVYNPVRDALFPTN